MLEMELPRRRIRGRSQKRIMEYIQRVGVTEDRVRWRQMINGKKKSLKICLYFEKAPFQTISSYQLLKLLFFLCVLAFDHQRETTQYIVHSAELLN